MILDKELLLSDHQAVTATVVSTNILDLQGENQGDQGPGEPLNLFAQVTDADFTTGTSIAVSVYTDDDVAFGSATELYSTPAIALADLVAGYNFALGSLPIELNERYLRFTYTVVGTMAVGTITAGIVSDKQAGM